MTASFICQFGVWPTAIWRFILLSNLLFISFSKPDKFISELTLDSFDSIVTESNELWLVQFYAPWCDHCRSFAGMYEQIAHELKGIAKVGAVDCEKYPSLERRFEVSGFPSLHIFGSNKTHPNIYSGPRTVDDIVEKARLHLKLESDNRVLSDKSHILNVTNEIFDNIIIKSIEPWLVAFQIPNCSPCEEVEEILERLAADFKWRVHVASIDGTKASALVEQYGVIGYPSLVMFPFGLRKREKVVIYKDNNRTYENIEAWILKKSHRPIGIRKRQTKGIIPYKYTPGLATLELDDSTYDSKFMQNYKPWVLFFTAKWCGPCHQMLPAFQKVAAELFGKAQFAVLDIDKSPVTKQKLGLSSIPHIRFYPKGKKRQNGGFVIYNNQLRDADSIEKWVKEQLDPKLRSKKTPKVVVRELNSQQFRNLVMKSNEAWLVDFYAPWCGPCMQLMPTIDQVAEKLSGTVNVVKINCDTEQQLKQQFGIRYYPTLRLLPAGKKSYRSGWVLDGQKTYEGITSWVEKKLSGDDSDSPGGGKHVVKLDNRSFQQKVLRSKLGWIVDFYAPWCGHCKIMAPDFAKAAEKMVGKVNFASVDATQNVALTRTFNINGYPSIKYIPPNSNSLREAIDFEGERNLDGFVGFAENKWLLHLRAPEVSQVFNRHSFDKLCLNSDLCIIAVIPSALDCNAACRNRYIEIIRSTSERTKQHTGVTWAWIEAGSQIEMEKSVGLYDNGYPSLVGLNPEKQLFYPFLGSFATNSVTEFLANVLSGKIERFVWKPVEFVDDVKWTGKDARKARHDEL